MPDAGRQTPMRGCHAQSCQSTARRRSPRLNMDFGAIHIKTQGSGLLNRTCLLQLQMRFVFPLIESWTHRSYAPGLLVGFEEL